MLILAISNGMKTAIFIVALLLVFYFFMIRPQNQKQKAEQRFRDGLKKGDKVMTTGGIHGTVYSADAVSVQLEVAPGKRFTVAKSAIAVKC